MLSSNPMTPSEGVRGFVPDRAMGEVAHAFVRWSSFMAVRLGKRTSSIRPESRIAKSFKGAAARV